MRGDLRRELYLGIGLLLLVQVVIAFGAIGLLGRVAPAVERIMAENVSSLEAAEQLIATLAKGDVSADSQALKSFDEAVRRLRKNVTEGGEIPLIDRISAQREALARGDDVARVEIIEAATQLTELNREVMRKADARAQRLGMAGAWAAVFVSILGFAASVLVVNRLRRHIVYPLQELSDVFRDLDAGDHQRRCIPCESTKDVVELMERVNRNLDLWIGPPTTESMGHRRR